MKKILAVLMALTMMVSMFNIVAFATEEEVSSLGETTTVAGGKWANPAFEDNITTTLASNEDYKVTVSDNSMKLEPLKVNNTTGTTNMQFASKNIDSLNWIQTGCVEICYTMSYTGTLEKGDNFGFGVAFTSYNASSRVWILSANSWEVFPFESGVTKDIKYIVEFKDSETLVYRYIKDVDADSWTYVDTVTRNYVPSAEYKKIREIIPYGQQWIRSSFTDAAATMSNLSVREVYKNAELETLTESYDTVNDSSVDISYVLPENYDKAKLVIGGKTFKEFDRDTEDAGAYMTSVDLSALPYAGALPVELIAIDKNGDVTTKTTTLNVSAPTEKTLVAYNDYDGNQSTSGNGNYILNSTSGHIFENVGKEGAGLAISNMAEDENSTDCFFVANSGSLQSSAYINAIVDDTDEYCYDIEFDVKQEGAGGKIGINYKGYVDGKDTFYTDPAAPTTSKAWNWIVDKQKVAGVAGKFEFGEWHSMRFVVDTKANTVTTYYGTEEVATTEYVTDGCYYIGVGYALYAGANNQAAISVDNVKIYKYIPGNKTGIASVSVDPVTKAVSITADTTLSEENVTDANVTLTVGGNLRTAGVALATDGKTIVVTPNGTSALSGKDVVVTLAPEVIGYSVTIPVNYVADYSNRKIAVDEATSKVTASVDIIADEAGENAGIMYIAYYKDGNLVHTYKTDVITAGAGLATFTTTYTPEARVDYDTVRTFVWDASNTPLLKVYSK